MTNKTEQQAVPVAQEVSVLEDEFYALSARADETTPDENDDAYHVGVRDGYESAVQTVDMLTGGDGEYRFCMGAEDHASHCPDPPTMIRRIMNRIPAINEQPEDPAIFKRQSPPPHPCKSGEGADLAVWCAREAEAQRAEGNSSPHTAKLTREGRYDDQGVMPVAIAAARIALALTPDATQTREAELVAALEFYADRDSDGYRVDVTNYGLSAEEGEIVRDGGSRARAVLNARGGA